MTKKPSRDITPGARARLQNILCIFIISGARFLMSEYKKNLVQFKKKLSLPSEVECYIECAGCFNLLTIRIHLMTLV